MANPPDNKIVPLVEAAVAQRDRLIDREQRADGTDAWVTRKNIHRIDRWLTEFAYKHIVPGSWTK